MSDQVEGHPRSSSGSPGGKTGLTLSGFFKKLAGKTKN